MLQLFPHVGHNVEKHMGLGGQSISRHPFFMAQKCQASICLQEVSPSIDDRKSFFPFNEHIGPVESRHEIVDSSSGTCLRNALVRLKTIAVKFWR